MNKPLAASKSTEDEFWMRRALGLAEKAASVGEVPVGAVIVRNGELLAQARNQRESMNSPLAHAEILVIHRASQKLKSWRLNGCTLYVTLEPCVMCAGAIVQARVDRVVYGARDPKGGAVISLYEILKDQRLNHRCDIADGIQSEKCGQILKSFFRARRNQK